MPRKRHVAFGEGPTEKGRKTPRRRPTLLGGGTDGKGSQDTSLAAYSTLRGRGGGNVTLLPGTQVHQEQREQAAPHGQ